MERYVITTGDFLKNAGIVGMKYLLEKAKATENADFGITEDKQGLWIEKEFALNADWTDLYFKAFVQYFGPSTAYQRIMDEIAGCLGKLNAGIWKTEKAEKDSLKYICDKLLSNSYQAGFANIQNRIENPEVYLELKKHKMNEKLDPEELKRRLTQLQLFLSQPECQEIFSMKSIVYTYINRFWDGKCFLLRANAKKDMKALFEQEFSEPLRRHWREDHGKTKEICIDCGMSVEPKEKVSIAFMKEMGDDFTRKRSAFWNCKADAFLCPACAFVYALSPLGFQLFANKFVFLNTNENVDALLNSNSKADKDQQEKDKGEDERYTAWFSRNLNTVLNHKVSELANIQVILRGIQAEDRYLFSVISKDALTILKKDKVKEGLNYLALHPYVKLKGDFVNVHETAVMNILQYRDQYPLLDRLLKTSIETEGVTVTAFWVYLIQLWSGIIQRGEENGGAVAMSRKNMRDSGYELRKEIMRLKDTNSDDCMRGTIYQLLNALSVRNKEKFIDITIRLYSSTKLLMPDGFVYMLGNQDSFLEYGYAFVLGLKGSHPDNNRKKEEK